METEAKLSAEDPSRCDGNARDLGTTSSKDAPSNPLEQILPQLEKGDITFGELETAVKVLNAVADLVPSKKRKQGDEEGLELYKHSNLRPLRKALARCFEIHQRTMYQGKGEDEHYAEKIKARSLKRQKMAERDLQKKYIADTALRRGRMDRLKQKQSESQDEEVAKLQQMMMIPDGHVDTKSMTKLIANEEAKEPISAQLPNLRSCYVCKARFRELHHFYDQLCPPCAALNWEKRHQTASLVNKVAVVTGSRVKIGYQTCLKLLRAGATVVATTRFPNSAAVTYRQEVDFEQWKGRLQIYGLDLRDVTGIEAFCRFLKMAYSTCGIDILVNNACQTVRRPTAYYIPTCQKEAKLWREADETHKGILVGCVEFEKVRRRLLLDHKRGHYGNSHAERVGSSVGLLGNGNSSHKKPGGGSSESSLVVVSSNPSTEATSPIAPFETSGISHSAAMSQTVLLPEDAGVSESVLPTGVTDINGQQLDLRKTNSWLLKMEEVSTPEVMECMFINAIGKCVNGGTTVIRTNSHPRSCLPAPFVLNSRLKPLMRIPDSHDDRYIINVSAMEGKFYRYKMANHPHTNMAKAALNMMTRTSAEDLAKNHNIYMNSVDTGWINDENPLDRATKTAATNLFQTPIDEIDAAARILDPVFSGVRNRDAQKDYGKFLKDYRETEW